MGHWSSLDQVYIDSNGETGRRIYADWLIPTKEYDDFKSVSYTHLTLPTILLV